MLSDAEHKHIVHIVTERTGILASIEAFDKWPNDVPAYKLMFHIRTQLAARVESINEVLRQHPWVDGNVRWIVKCAPEMSEEQQRITDGTPTWLDARLQTEYTVPF